MKKFNHVIVRRPCKAMVEGITSGLYPGKPDYELALKEHDAYIEALKQCDVDVTVLEADERYPDSCFVEDPALITSKCAIITNPGAESRNGEKNEIIGAVKKFFNDEQIEYIKAPGTLEGGDVMMVGDHFYVGRSARTNEEGIRQLTEILAKYGMTCSEVKLEKVLHLKTGVNYLENNNMLVSGEFVTKPEFEKYNRVEIPEEEAYAANCIWVNDTVIVPAGYHRALHYQPLRLPVHGVFHYGRCNLPGTVCCRSLPRQGLFFRRNGQYHYRHCRRRRSVPHGWL